MNRSANEISGIVLKAARGAGLPLGIAEDLSVLAGKFASADLLALAEAMEDQTRHAGLCDLCLAKDLGHVEENSESSGGTLELRGSGPALGRRVVEPAVWARLDALAQRTYVPESEQSRESGAGAGNIDND